jgi:hypothetical protein
MFVATDQSNNEVRTGSRSDRVSHSRFVVPVFKARKTRSLRFPVLTSSQWPKITKKQTSPKPFLQKLAAIGNNILAVFLFCGVRRSHRSFQAAFIYF